MNCGSFGEIGRESMRVIGQNGFFLGSVVWVGDELVDSGAGYGNFAELLMILMNSR